MLRLSSQTKLFLAPPVRYCKFGKQKIDMVVGAVNRLRRNDVASQWCTPNAEWCMCFAQMMCCWRAFRCLRLLYMCILPPQAVPPPLGKEGYGYRKRKFDENKIGGDLMNLYKKTLKYIFICDIMTMDKCGVICRGGTGETRPPTDKGKNAECKMQNAELGVREKGRGEPQQGFL